MKKHDTIDEVMLLEAHEASELLDKGSYYFEQDGKIGRIETFVLGARELHNTDLVILGYYCGGCTGYPCVTKELYQQLTNETV